MIIKYDLDIENEAIQVNIRRLINKVFKLLPSREEGYDWEKELDIVIEEVYGMNELLLEQDNLFKLLCHLEGLHSLNKDEDFSLYRRTIFECLTILEELKNDLELRYDDNK